MMVLVRVDEERDARVDEMELERAAGAQCIARLERVDREPVEVEEVGRGVRPGDARPMVPVQMPVHVHDEPVDEGGRERRTLDDVELAVRATAKAVGSRIACSICASQWRICARCSAEIVGAEASSSGGSTRKRRA